MVAEDTKAGFREETIGLVARRLLYALGAFVATMASAWVFEQQTHPQRTLPFFALLAVETCLLFLPFAATRLPTWRRHAIGIAGAAYCTVAVLMGAYHVIVRGEAEVLALALSFLVTGTTVALPWGVWPQLAEATTALLTYVVALTLGVPALVSVGLGFLGLVAIGTMSVGGAYSLERYRWSIFRQARDLLRANEALSAAGQAKTEFVANVSHELRTPLATILGYTDLLLDRQYGDVPTDMREPLERIDRSATALLALIGDLIDIARIESGRLVMQLEDVPLETMFKETEDTAESLLRGKPVRFSTAGASGLHVRADAQRLRQILVNLVTNAVKYTQRGRIELDASREPGREVVIRVHDTGVGIPPRELQTIFEPFQRGSQRGDTAGVGLGLALSVRLARLMNGDISVSSAPGEGSTFTLHLPAAQS